jgi:phosphatidylserine/phosphatidylglycerophosphate/cardiolipin synthase-like enzyme
MAIRNLAAAAFATLCGCHSLASASEMSATPYKPPSISTNAKIEVRFNPGGDCLGTIVSEIGKATSTILMLAYSYTSDDIERALVAARGRGVDVQIIVDSARTRERYGSSRDSKEAGIPVYSDGAHAIQHQKVIVIDAGLDTSAVITGSFNFTSSAEKRNSENITIIRDKNVAEGFEENWQDHREHSEEFMPAPQSKADPPTANELLAAAAIFFALFLGLRAVYRAAKLRIKSGGRSP